MSLALCTGHLSVGLLKIAFGGSNVSLVLLYWPPLWAAGVLEVVSIDFPHPAQTGLPRGQYERALEDQHILPLSY